MLKDCQSIAARVLLCWIDRLAAFCVMVAWPPTMRPPLGSAVGATDCAALSSARPASASATAAATTRLLGTRLPGLLQARGPYGWALIPLRLFLAPKDTSGVTGNDTVSDAPAAGRRVKAATFTEP